MRRRTNLNKNYQLSHHYYTVQLSFHDLQQFNKDYLSSLSVTLLIQLCLKLLVDLKEAHDRLNQNPQNSSRPPSSQPPWDNSKADNENNNSNDGEPSDIDSTLTEEDYLSGSLKDTTKNEEEEQNTQTDDDPENTDEKASDENKGSGKPSGKQAGAQGFGLKFGTNIEIRETIIHKPTCCSSCDVPFSIEINFKSWTGRDEIELVTPLSGVGLELIKTRHIYQEAECSCGHHTREEPGRCEKEEDWKVELTEWHMAGSNLVTFIASLSQRQRLSRVRIHEFLLDWLGLHVSVGTINQCIHEAGRALSAVLPEIINEIRQAELLYADETSWKESKAALWLWVFTCATATLFIVGRREKRVAQKILCGFDGWLMSDGYQVYRDYEWRLRCWAHLIRKARGLAESTEQQAQKFGKRTLQTLEAVMDSIYQARENPTEAGLYQQQAIRLGLFWKFCDEHWNCEHKKTKELAREFCYDWDAIWRILEYPSLPLTNNEAERALRHWVISRRISFGTRTPEGTAVFTSIASVIDTCYKRKVSPWKYIAEVIKLRRKGLAVPHLPVAA